MGFKDKKGQLVLKAGLGYTIGNILIKGINFLALPIFSRIMTTAEFGIYNVFVSYEAILYVIVGLAIHSSIRSANVEFREKISEYTSSVSLIYIVNGFLLEGVVFLCGKQLSQLTGFDESILHLLVLYSFGNAILTLYNNRISLEYSYKKYLIVAFLNSVGNVLLSLYLILVVFKKHREFGRILGVTVTVFIISVVLLCFFYKQAKPKFKKLYWGFAIKYSLPIVPHGISQVLLAQFDRIMIKTLVGAAEAGIYSLATNVKLIMTIIIDSISTAWSTWFYEEIENGNKKTIQMRADQLCCLFTIFTIGMMSISPELIYILGGKEYDMAKYVVVPMVLDAFILFLYNIVVVSEYYRKKTTYIMVGTLVAAVINVITNYIFILKYGAIAAAYTTLFSYTLYLILHLIISYSVIKFHIIPIVKLLLYVVVVILVAGVDLLFIDLWWLRYGVALLWIGIFFVWLAKSTGIYKIKK